VAATPAPSAGALEKSFIQIGIFSVKGNADNTATSLRGAGVLPIVKEQENQGKPFYRVLVGPATNKSERATLLKTVKGLGFTDAYFVTN
jgi:cell division septation protein DedD